MKKTDPTVERQVIELIALGYRYRQISSQTGVAVPTIKKIKKRNPARIDAVQQAAVEQDATEARVVLSKIYKQLHRLLDKAERGEVDISLLTLVKLLATLHERTDINLPQGQT